MIMYFDWIYCLISMIMYFDWIYCRISMIMYFDCMILILYFDCIYCFNINPSYCAVTISQS